MYRIWLHCPRVHHIVQRVTFIVASPAGRGEARALESFSAHVVREDAAKNAYITYWPLSAVEGVL